MRTPRRILVAVKDPRAKSLPAVDKAVQLARAFDAQIELFHGVDTPVFQDYELNAMTLADIQRTRREGMLSHLDVVAARIRKLGVKVSAAVECDWPAHEAIVRRAQATRADLIVAECHAGRHFAPWLLRLTDWELLRYSPVPVLLVKDKRPYRNPVLLAAVDPTHAFAKPSKLDEDILDAAAKVRTALRGALHVMHAFVPLPNDAKPSELLDEKAAKRLEARARKHARVGFERVLRKAGIRLAPARRHLVGRHPINAIPELARRTRSSIVVMGAVSRSGLKRVFIGNTAERALDDLPCDVLVVKPRQFVSKVAVAPRPTRIVPAPLPLPY